MTTKDTPSRPHRGDLEWMPGTQNGFIICEKVHTAPSQDHHQPLKAMPASHVGYSTQSPWMFYVVISLGVVGGGLTGQSSARLLGGSPSQMNGHSFSQPTEWSLGL